MGHLFWYPSKNHRQLGRAISKKPLFSRYASVLLLKDVGGFKKKKLMSSLKEKKHFKMEFCCSFTH